jgi:gliding-associated putative ABC transporter substrate-binding component GldG
MIKSNLKKLVASVSIVLIVNVLGNLFFKRFDLTKDKRYTLSETSLNIVKQIKEPLYIDIYLNGEFPAEFKRLRSETVQIIEEFQAYNSNIKVQFVNPFEEEDTNKTVAKSLFKKGMSPINITVEDRGKQSQAMIFPWGVANYRGKEANIPLLKNLMGATTEQKVAGSVQHLEYVFADALNKITTEKNKKIAVIKGNGELDDVFLAKFLLQVRESYHIGKYNLSATDVDPITIISELKKYDLAIIAKPTTAFSDKEKQVLDQFIIAGGKTIWLIDQVNIEMDSLYNQSGSTLAFSRDLNLDDMFFKYGFRITPEIIKDNIGTPLKLATGQEGSGSRLQEFNWKFAPNIFSESNHPIVKNMGGLKFDFVNPIDTLKNKIAKTILLKSSQNSRRIGTPSIISLSSVAEEDIPNNAVVFASTPVAVLLEGQFHSVFENRVLAFQDKSFKNFDKLGKMIVISDGDVIKNKVDKNGIPIELGYDPKSGNFYDNKDFMLNCVNYLLDDNGLINIRSKDVDLPLLDKDKVFENYSQTQVITIGLPLVLLIAFGFAFTFWRKRKYSKKCS